jgi:hypothetical protein
MDQYRKRLIIIRIIIFLLGLFSAFPLTAQVRRNSAADLISTGGSTFNDRRIIPAAPFMVPDTFQLLPWVKQDFMINELAGDYGAEQLSPVVAADSNGNYAIAWIDKRKTFKEIYIQFFNNQDERLGNNVLVSERGCSWNTYLSIAANKRGDFIVAWVQSYYEVIAQRFSKTGIKIGGNFSIKSENWYEANDLSVAIYEDGSFLVSWNNESIPTARLFDYNGNPVSSEVILKDAGTLSGYFNTSHSVAVDGQGNFVVVWNEYINSFSKIFLQRLDPQGTKIGNNIMISDSIDTRNHYNPSVAATDDGYFLIVWGNRDPVHITSGVNARIFHIDGHMVSDQLVISGNDVYSHSCTVTDNGKDTFLVFEYGGAVKCQQVGKSGELLGDKKTLRSDSSDSMYVNSLNVSGINAYQVYMTFMKYQLMDPDVFVQKYDRNLMPEGMKLKVNDDPFSSYQNNPLVCFNQQGGSIVLWEDQRNGRQDLYAQVYDFTFNPVGENIQINDIPQGYWFLVDKKADALSDGTFIVGFCGAEYIDYGNIYLQAVSMQGYKINGNKLVKENYQKYNLELKVDQQDQILLCWYNQYSAYMRKYNQDLLAISAEKSLYKYDQNRDYKPVSLSINNDLNIFVSWVYYDRLTYDYDHILYGLVYDQIGKVISDTMIINKWNSYHYMDAFDNYMTDEDDYVVVWIDQAGLHSTRIFATDRFYSYTNSIRGINSSDCRISIPYSKNQKTLITYSTSYDVLGLFFNDNKRQSRIYKLYHYNSSTHGDGQFYHAAIFKDNLFFTYESNQHGETGFDIWGNVQNLADIDFDPELFRPPISDDTLYPNFPNPFKGTTTISYELLAYHKVKLAVYDVLGREVRVLLDRKQEKGYYEVEFNAVGLASGIYFVRLEAFRTKVRKMVLLK